MTVSQSQIKHPLACPCQKLAYSCPTWESLVFLHPAEGKARPLISEAKPVVHLELRSPRVYDSVCSNLCLQRVWSWPTLSLLVFGNASCLIKGKDTFPERGIFSDWLLALTKKYAFPHPRLGVLPQRDQHFSGCLTVWLLGACCFSHHPECSPWGQVTHSDLSWHLRGALHSLLDVELALVT